MWYILSSYSCWKHLKWPEILLYMEVNILACFCFMEAGWARGERQYIINSNIRDQKVSIFVPWALINPPSKKAR